jgi:integrase
VDVETCAGNLDGWLPAPRAVLSPVRDARRAGQARPRRVDELPAIRLHDLRHTHATLLLADGVPVKVVSERLGHASATITLTVYQHVHPGMGREAADRFAALLGGRP